MSNELLIPLDNIDTNIDIDTDIDTDTDTNNIEIDKTHYRRFIFTTILASIISMLYFFTGYFYIPIYHASILLFTGFIKHNEKKLIDIFLFSNFIITIFDFVFIFILPGQMFHYIISILVFITQLISLVTIHNYKMKLVN